MNLKGAALRKLMMFSGAVAWLHMRASVYGDDTVSSPGREPSAGGSEVARVLIAHDHFLVREGLKKILSEQPDLRVVGEAGNTVELLAALRSTPADVVVLDVNMPGGDPFETLRRIGEMRPLIPVLMMSAHQADDVAPRFLQLGAAGVLWKDTAAQEVVNAIRRVRAGKRYVSPALAEALAGAIAHPGAGSLSPRELQVLRRIAGGRSVKEVAADLGITVSTVHTHRIHILQKLKLHSDVDLTRYAFRQHLVD